MNPSFDHEKLRVYQEAIRLVAWVNGILENIPKSLSVHIQLDRASTSIPLNIAEGNGKFTAPDRCKYFDIARGSSLEFAGCLDVLVAKKKIKAEEAAEGKEIILPIVSMLVGLIKRTSPDRVYEKRALYGRSEGEGTYDYD